MKNVKILFLILVSTFSLSAAAQNIGNYIDVVHLKNGSIIKGIIIEQIPGKSVRIKTSDGSEYVYPETAVVKFTKEEKPKEVLKLKDNPMSYINNYKRKGKGYFFEAEILNSQRSSGLRITNGYRFNRFAKLGIALGGETLNIQNYGGYLGRSQIQRLSANLVLSGDVLDKRITPFYQFELGYAFDPNYYSNSYTRNFDTNGPMIGGMFGVRFKTKKKIEYKLGLDLRMIGTNAYTGENDNPSIGIRFGIGF